MTIVTLGEEDVIILVAFERGVKIYKVSRFIFDVAAEYFINTDWHGQKHGPTRTETRTGTEVEQEIRPSVVARKPQPTCFMNCFNSSIFI